MSRAVDAFWGLPPTVGVSVSGAAPTARWIVLEPRELDLPDPRRILLPELRPVRGEPILNARTAAGEEAGLAGRLEDGSVELAYDPDATVRALIWRRALTVRRPLAARMPFHYHRVPASVRRLLRDLLTRRQGAADGYPAWPGDPSVEAARLVYLRARQVVEPGLEPAPFWPDGKRYALALTHDVDTAAGLDVARSMATDEGERGLRSCWYLVGEGYPQPAAALDELRSAGGELGLHDVHHDNKIAFLDREDIAARLDGARDRIEGLGARGFRSPSLLRSAALYDVLEDRFEYDSSIPDSGLLPTRNGCATVFPFERGRLPILPLTVPPDGQLLGRGLSPKQVVAAWMAKVEWVASLGGAAVHLTHPEQGFSASADMRAAYREFLDWAADQAAGPAWHALPVEIVEHWVSRSTAPASAEAPPA